MQTVVTSPRIKGRASERSLVYGYWASCPKKTLYAVFPSANPWLKECNPKVFDADVERKRSWSKAGKESRMMTKSVLILILMCAWWDCKALSTTSCCPIQNTSYCGRAKLHLTRQSRSAGSSGSLIGRFLCIHPTVHTWCQVIFLFSCPCQIFFVVWNWLQIKFVETGSLSQS